MSANNRTRHNKGAKITRHSWASAGHEPRVIIKSTRSRLLTSPCWALLCSSTMFPECPWHCASTMFPRFPHKQFHGETLYTHTPDLTFISPDTTEMSDRSIMTDSEVPFTPLSSFSCTPSLYFFKMDEIWLRDSLTFLTGTCTPNLSNFPVPAGILKHLSSVIGWARNVWGNMAIYVLRNARQITCTYVA